MPKELWCHATSCPRGSWLWIFGGVLLDIWLGCGFNQETVVFLKVVHGVVMCCYFLGAGILWMDECLEDGRNEEVFFENSSPLVRRWKTRHPIRYSANMDWMSFFFSLRFKPGISRGQSWNCPSFTRPYHYPIRYITSIQVEEKPLTWRIFTPEQARKRWGEIRVSTAGGREIWNFWDTL